MMKRWASLISNPGNSFARSKSSSRRTAFGMVPPSIESAVIGSRAAARKLLAPAVRRSCFRASSPVGQQNVTRRNNSMVLVVGGTSGTGALIVRLLERQKVPVRVLARDRAKAAALFSSRVEVVAGDITQSHTLPAAIGGAS